MAWVNKLVCGSLSLSFDADWRIQEGGYSPNPPKGRIIYGGASIGNGSYRTGSEAENREIHLRLALADVTSRAVLQSKLHDLFEFFQMAKQAAEGGSIDRVYFMHQFDESITGTVLLGRGPVYYEVQSCYVNVPQTAYTLPLTATNPSLIDVDVALVCLSHGVGKPMFLAEGTGWYRYSADNDLRIWSGTTNLFLNPSFEHATFSTDWASDAALTMAVEYERVHQPRDTITFQACRLCNTDAAVNCQLYSIKTLTAANYAISCYAYTDGSPVTSADLALYAGTAGGASIIATTYTADADNPGWYRLTPTAGYFTADAVARAEGVSVYPGKTVLIDNGQLELSPLATPICIGDQGPGLAFSGTAHNSTSVRTAGQHRLRTLWSPHPGYEVLFYGAGALSLWAYSEWAGNDGVGHCMIASQLAATQDLFRLEKGSDNILRFIMYGSTAGGYKELTFGVDASTWSVNTYHHVYITWDESGPLSLWLDGVVRDTVVATGGTWTNLDMIGTYVYVGSRTNAAQQFNGYISDLRIFGADYALDAGKTVADVYAAGRGKTELPALWTSAIGGAVQSTDDSANKNYFWIAGIPGDVDAPLRLLIHNDGGSETTGKLALHHKSTFPFSLNTLSLVGDYYPAGGTWTDTADATRSGGTYYRYNSSAASVFFALLSDTRKIPYIADWYNIMLIARDNAGATGSTYFLVGIAQDTAATLAGSSSKHAASPYSDKMYADRVALWTVMDMSALPIPITSIPLPFTGQKRQTVDLPVYPVSLWVREVASAAINLDLDYVVFMPKDGLLAFECESNMVTVIDAIGGGLAWEAYESSNDITMGNDDSVTADGVWPLVAPRRWTFGNVVTNRAVTGDQTPADAVKLFAHYQARYLWGR